MPKSKGDSKCWKVGVYRVYKNLMVSPSVSKAIKWMIMIFMVTACGKEDFLSNFTTNLLGLMKVVPPLFLFDRAKLICCNFHGKLSHQNATPKISWRWCIGGGECARVGKL